MRYRAEIDGLRALAVIPVILFHAGVAGFSGGFVGVDVFFVISGYLITTLILDDSNQGRFSIVTFYERRARRILPALFFVIVACLPFAWLWLLPAEMKSFSHSLASVSIFSSNFFFWKSSGYFDNAAELKPLLHTWSLAVEEQYYVLFPLLLMLGIRFGKRRFSAGLAGLALVSLAAAQLMSAVLPVAGFFLLPTRGWELLSGALVAIYLSGNPTPPAGRKVAEAACVIGAIGVLYAIVLFDAQTPFPSLYALVPVAGAALLIVFATPRTLVGRLLGSRPLVGIGLISYSAYLWHYPLFAFARIRAGTPPRPGVFAILAVASVALAYLTWKYVETPFRDRNRFSRKHIFATAAIGTALLLLIGIGGGLNHGNMLRYSAQDMEIAGSIEGWEAYVWRRKGPLQLQPYASSAKKRILIIGDSSAGDLINALAETGPDVETSLSSYTINYGCGNLALDKRAFDSFIDRNRASVCRKNKRYDNPKLQRLIRNADVVVLATRWLDWEVRLLDRSLHHLTMEYGEKFVVLGTKSVEFNIRDILKSPVPDRFKLTAAPDSAGLRINADLQKLHAVRVVNPYDLLCVDLACPLFDDRNHLITFDGFHLTNDGARLFGKRLRANPIFDDILK